MRLSEGNLGSLKGHHNVTKHDKYPRSIPHYRKSRYNIANARLELRKLMPNKPVYRIDRLAKVMHRVYTIELDWIPPRELRGNSRTDRRAATTERVRVRQSGKDHGVFLIASEGILEPLESFEMSYEVWHNRTTIDLDNLLFGYKAFCDGLQDAGFFKSDSARHLRHLSIRWGGRVKKDESRTVVEIVDLDNGVPLRGRLHSWI